MSETKHMFTMRNDGKNLTVQVIFEAESVTAAKKLIREIMHKSWRCIDKRFVHDRNEKNVTANGR